MTDIKEGDQVPWNFGGGAPEGQVAEVATSGEMKIESKGGKEIKANASEESPGVHVAREGNDVVKRASALTKLDDANNESEGAQASDDAPKNDEISHEKSRENGHADKQTDKTDEAQEEPQIKTNGNDAAADKPAENGHANGKIHETNENQQEEEDKMDISASPSQRQQQEDKVEVGEKRMRDVDDDGHEESNDAHNSSSDRENGKESKKAKLDDDSTMEGANYNGTATVAEDAGENNAPSTEHQPPPQTTTKKSATRSSKKSEAEATGNEETSEQISARTRSKAA